MIRISIDPGNAKASSELISKLRPLTGKSFLELRSIFEEGAPIFDGDPFSRPPKETISHLRSLLDIFDQADCQLSIKENGREVTSNILRNILSSYEEIERQENELIDLGHDA